MAAIQGINLDEGDTSGKEKFEEVKRRVEAKKLGVSEEQLFLEDMGIDVESM